MSVVTNATYPFLFIYICKISPSTFCLHEYDLSVITQNSCPFFSAIAKYLSFDENSAVFISTDMSVMFSPD